MIRSRFDWIRNECNPTDLILDVGGNDGHTFTSHERVVTFDIDLYHLENFVRGDAHYMPFKNGAFDVAVLAEILEHVKDPVSVLKEAKRVAQKIVITVPYEYEWSLALHPFKKYWKHELKREALTANPNAKEFYQDNYVHLFHQRYYTPDTFKAHLKAAGYEHYQLSKVGGEDTRGYLWSWLLCISP